MSRQETGNRPQYWHKRLEIFHTAWTTCLEQVAEHGFCDFDNFFNLEAIIVLTTLSVGWLVWSTTLCPYRISNLKVILKMLSSCCLAHFLGSSFLTLGVCQMDVREYHIAARCWMKVKDSFKSTCVMGTFISELQAVTLNNTCTSIKKKKSFTIEEDAIILSQQLH